MSENTHIDRIFKDGLGEMNFSNVDAMWQKMDAELDKDGGKKRRPVLFFVLLACLLTAGVFTFNHFNKTASADTVIAEAKNERAVLKEAGSSNTAVNKILKDKNTAAVKTVPLPGSGISDNISIAVSRKPLTVPGKRQISLATIAPVNSDMVEEEAVENTIVTGVQQATEDEIFLEKITAVPDLAALPQWKRSAISFAPVSQNFVAKPAERKREAAKANSITIEAVAGGDLLRLNRKAGYYAGIRINKHVEEGTVISAGINYASHTVLDKYRVATKPAEQRSSDARINSISSIRMPLYLQRQMGQTKFAMMIGLVPTYITQAEVYNVPDSYIGDPNPYRKFGLADINRFNLLFGAGIRYSPFNDWLSFELSGNYGLTGLVKDGYKNLSRVNDNFKSIQLGVALRLK